MLMCVCVCVCVCVCLCVCVSTQLVEEEGWKYLRQCERDGYVFSNSSLTSSRIASHYASRPLARSHLGLASSRREGGVGGTGGAGAAAMSGEGGAAAAAAAAGEERDREWSGTNQCATFM